MQSCFGKRCRKFESLPLTGNRLVFVMKDGTKVECEWHDKSRSRSWTDEMRVQAAEHARRRYEK